MKFKIALVTGLLYVGTVNAAQMGQFITAGGTISGALTISTVTITGATTIYNSLQVIKPEATSMFSVSQNGLVGIGTSNPTATFHTVGNSSFTTTQFVGGEVTQGKNAYGFFYRTNPHNGAAITTWTTLPMDVSTNTYNLTYSSPNVQINVDGLYQISYGITYKRNVGNVYDSRLLVNGTTEVAGSFCEESAVTGDSGEIHSVERTVITRLNNTDTVALQYGYSVEGYKEVDLSADANLPQPTTNTYAAITITKIAP